MSKRRDTTANTGQHFTASTRKRVRGSKAATYAAQSKRYNPVAGLEPDVPTGHVQSRKGNTMNNRANGGGAMFDTTFKREGRAG